tara:strand:- start:391 stop:1203 length:813 start_codon:yes stop_codon:yes gene_type:complete
MLKIISEIGWNHMGNMELAKKMIVESKNSGADFAKFQTWKVKNLKKGPWDKDGRLEIYKKAELSENQHYELKDFCEQKNIKFLTSVFNEEDIDFLSKLKLEYIKIPSHEIYNKDLIKKSIDTFPKVLLSTGASLWSEILELIEKFGTKNIIYMHCTSAYPCKPENINFPRFLELKKKVETIGYSGHLSGVDDAKIAFALGAKYVEKHFTIDTNLPGRDNKFAILPADLKNLNNFRNNYIKMFEDKGLDFQKSEKDIFENYRGRWNKHGKI